jgi:hypothetical protein
MEEIDQKFVDLFVVGELIGYVERVLRCHSGITE